MTDRDKCQWPTVFLSCSVLKKRLTINMCRDLPLPSSHLAVMTTTKRKKQKKNTESGVIYIINSYRGSEVELFWETWSEFFFLPFMSLIFIGGQKWN